MNGNCKTTRRVRLGAACTGAAVAGLLGFSGAGAIAGSAAPHSADLSINKTDSPDPVVVGKTLTYTIEVVNAGPDNATDVVVTDRLARSLDFVSVTATKGTCKKTGRTVTCTINNLVADGTDPYVEESKSTITIEVKPTEAGKVTNTARVTSEVADPIAANNADTVTTKVNKPAGGGNKPTCAGVEATIVGTSEGEVLNGTDGRDVILARGGDDEIYGNDGNDLICAGRGADVVKAGAGRDIMRGAGGKDRMAGQGGNDKVRGQARGDRLRGGAGDDLLAGGPGKDRCRGGSGADTLKSCEE